MKEYLQKFMAVKTIFYLIAFGILGYGMWTKNQSPQNSTSTTVYQSGMNIICFDKHCFDIEIADTEFKRKQGLMNRDSLGAKNGMLFVFDSNQIQPFWMKDTRIPLDIIWLDSQGTITDIQTAIPCTQDPCTIYTPSKSGLYVLEINAGISQLLGLTTGSIAQFNKK